MKALVHDGSGHIALEDRPEPQLQSPHDAIIRVTCSTVCTSDPHIIHGAVPRATPKGAQTLPLHEMYGKNLVFKTGGVDACNLNETMRLVQEGRIDTSCLISGRYPLNDIVEAYRAFEAHEGGCLKLVITPWEDR